MKFFCDITHIGLASELVHISIHRDRKGFTFIFECTYLCKQINVSYSGCSWKPCGSIPTVQDQEEKSPFKFQPACLRCYFDFIDDMPTQHILCYMTM